MKKILSMSVLLFCFFCACAQKPDFPLYGITFSDTPETVIKKMKKTPYTKESELINKSSISFSYISKTKDRLSFNFYDRELTFITYTFENGNFTDLFTKLKASMGYPLFYDKENEEAKWEFSEYEVMLELCTKTYDFSNLPEDIQKSLIENIKPQYRVTFTGGESYKVRYEAAQYFKNNR